MTAPLGEIAVDIEARLGKLDSKLKEGLRKSERFAKEAEKKSTFNLGGFEAVAKGFAGLAAVETTLKGLTALTAAMEGDLNSVDRVVRSLPLGLGPAIGAALDFKNAMTGAADQAARAAEIAADLKKGRSVQNQRFDNAQALIREFGGSLSDLRLSDSIDRQDDLAKQMTLLANETNKRMREIDASVASATANTLDRSTRQKIQNAAELLKREINRESAEIAGQIGEQMAKRRAEVIAGRGARRLGGAVPESDIIALTDQAARAGRARNAARAQEREQARQRDISSNLNAGSIIGQNRILALELAGRRLDARIESINQTYADRIQQARERGGEGSEEARRALFTQKDLEIARAKQEENRPSFSQFQSFEAGQFTGSTMKRTPVDLPPEVVQILRDMERNTAKDKPGLM